ncbi:MULTISPECIES: hypothetical protein [unclassified Microbacterium]|uniref:hypothetical protein n=1 Tax=unclassified Microbacterium TaxID=2609290 RepID=UPI00386E12C5
MLNLHYSDASVVTTEAVAEAVMRYAQTLSSNEQSDLVTIPIVDRGDVATSTMLIGPTSQFHTTPYHGPAPEIDDEESLMILFGRADALLHPPSASSETRHDDDDETATPWDGESF